MIQKSTGSWHVWLLIENYALRFQVIVIETEKLVSIASDCYYVDFWVILNSKELLEYAVLALQWKQLQAPEQSFLD